MTYFDFAGLILTILSIIALLSGGIKWLTKHYFDEIKAEFKPNGGNSMKDAISRLENDVLLLKDHMIREEKEQNELNRKIDSMYQILLDYISKR